MTCRPLLAAALLLGTTAPVMASPAPSGDPRIAHHRYAANEVVRISGQSGIQAAVAFAEDEHIENVAIGDSASWQVTPNKRANMLFVKPLAPKARTNMTVVTDRHTYYFDLVAGAAAVPLYVLRFTYPDEPKRSEPGANGQPTLTDAEAGTLTERPTEATIDPASLNFAWKAKGKPRLLPARVYDDGQSTFLSWSPKTPIPAIQIRDESGTEGPVNFAVRGDVIVIEGVPRIILLRSGRDLASLERATSAAPASGTPALAAAPAGAPAGAATPSAKEQ